MTKTTPEENGQHYEKRLKEAHQWGHDLSPKLKGITQLVDNYVAQGALTEAESKKILAQSNHAIPETFNTPTSLTQSPLHLYAQVWDSELDNMRKYSNDANIDQYVYAFQHFLANATTEET